MGNVVFEEPNMDVNSKIGLPVVRNWAFFKHSSIKHKV